MFLTVNMLYAPDPFPVLRDSEFSARLENAAPFLPQVFSIYCALGKNAGRETLRFIRWYNGGEYPLSTIQKLPDDTPFKLCLLRQHRMQSFSHWLY